MVRQKSGEMASPTPSIDSLNGVLAMCDTTDHPIDTYSHVFSGLGSSSGVSSATSSSSSASSLDRASTGSASSTSGQCPRTERHQFTFNILHMLCCVVLPPPVRPATTLLLIWGRWRLEIFLSIMIMTYSWHFLSVNEKSGNCWLISDFIFLQTQWFFISVFYFKGNPWIINEWSLCLFCVNLLFYSKLKMEINKVFFPGLSSSPLGGGSFTSSNTKCPVCSGAFVSPKVLPCFHTFCQPCLERCQVTGSVSTLQTCILFQHKSQYFS